MSNGPSKQSLPPISEWSVAVDKVAVIDTLNKKHLGRFVPAEYWKDIHPM